LHVFLFTIAAYGDNTGCVPDLLQNSEKSNQLCSISICTWRSSKV